MNNARNDIFDDYSGPENPNPVYVVFRNNEENWRRVVEEADESLCVVDEDCARFEVEYETAEEFAKGMERFEGLVEYEIINGQRAIRAAGVKP